MRLTHCLGLFILLQVFSCQAPPPAEEADHLLPLLESSPSIAGKTDFAATPYVTAGDRLYLVGHQDGTFPDLGWHVKGEMGGIWNHPVKLMDGFVAQIEQAGTTQCLNQADQFTNYPFGSVLQYDAPIPALQVQQLQFVPDGKEAIVIEYTLKNTGTTPLSFQFNWNAMVDLRPVWLGERTGMIDGPDQITWDAATSTFTAKDSLNDWYTAWRANTTIQSHEIGSTVCDFERLGMGANAALSIAIELEAQGQQTIQLVVAGSNDNQAAAIATLQSVQRSATQLLLAKQQRYQKLAAQTQLTIPNPQIQQAFEWVKYNTDWLVRDVPGIGRGLSAGIPDYPWWFGCDNTYSLQGVLATGRADLAYSTLELIKMLSDSTNGNGRIIHEASTNGAVFNPGNINETPHFSSMVWTMYEWTGDKAFLERYYPLVVQGLDWLLSANDADGNFLADGFGMMEIHGLDSEMIDVAVYSQQGFEAAAKMAGVLGDDVQQTKFEQIAMQLQHKINTDFWVADFNSYADFIGTTTEALHLIDDAIVRADTLGKPWAVEELKATKAKIASYPPDQKQGFVLYHNWVVNTPMEMGIADPEKARLALETGAQFVNPFGVFVTGIDRDESAGSDDDSFAARKKIFSYVGAVMTLPTGVQAIAENNYGNPDKALEYLERMVSSFSYALPGSMYEVSPDFGMIAQAWNVYALTVPIVQQFFGIQPKAYAKLVTLQPQFPAAWKKGQLENVPVGDNELTVRIKATTEGETIAWSQTKDWSIRLQFPKGKYTQWTTNGKTVEIQSDERWDYATFTESEVTLTLQ
ncbi:MAG: glycogen debranching protein [Bacteroidota bacterium]